MPDGDVNDLDRELMKLAGMVGQGGQAAGDLVQPVTEFLGGASKRRLNKYIRTGQ